MGQSSSGAFLVAGFESSGATKRSASVSVCYTHYVLCECGGQWTFTSPQIPHPSHPLLPYFLFSKCVLQSTSKIVKLGQLWLTYFWAVFFVKEALRALHTRKRCHMPCTPEKGVICYIQRLVCTSQATVRLSWKEIG